MQELPVTGVWLAHNSVVVPDIDRRKSSHECVCLACLYQLLAEVSKMTHRLRRLDVGDDSDLWHDRSDCLPGEMTSAQWAARFPELPRRVDILVEMFETREEALSLVGGDAERADELLSLRPLWVRRGANKRARVIKVLGEMPLQGWKRVEQDSGASTVSAELFRPKLSAPSRWRSRLAKRLQGETELHARRKLKDEELRRWAEEILGYIREAKLPAVGVLQETRDPIAAGLRLFGVRRATTLRSRARRWRKIRAWLRAVHRVDFPTRVSQMLDLLESEVDAAREGKGGKTIPGDIAASLSLLEGAGGVAIPDRISQNGIWLASVKSAQVELEKGSAPKKQALSPTLATVLALELYVCCEQREPYLRVVAWAKLLKVWMCLRWDDLQAIDPLRVTLSLECLTAIICETKTSGPGRRIQELKGFVLRRASISGVDWLGVGLTLFRTFSSERDYFLPEPNHDFTGVRSRMLGYSLMSAISRRLLSQLPPARRTGGRWKLLADRLLFPHETSKLLTEHSERHFLVNVAVAAQVDKEKRDFLGRWLIKGGSSDYLTMSRQIVLEVQEVAVQFLTLGINDKFYREEELLEKMVAEAAKFGLQARLEVAEFRVLHTTGPRGAGAPVALPLQVDAEEPPEWTESVPASKEAETGAYWYSVGKRGARRLHRVGGCKHPARSLCYVDTIEEAQADSVCKHCWPPRNTSQQGADGLEDDSSSVSSSSSDSEKGV